KGIGLAIVRALCKQFPGDVYLTARDPGRGQEAVAKLQQEGLRALFHQLDIDDLQSIRALRDFLKEKYGGLNVLVNNAGIAFKGRKGSVWGSPVCYQAVWRGLWMQPTFVCQWLAALLAGQASCLEDNVKWVFWDLLV
ncbi:carbonyl reductase [NADPH] 1-like, partial [Neopelma chrysocephalum]|uniref:carbonyl reductase [NADPH] 1-like n=1 Tax=Neopelma chrysocephalum TaxID=114329 RepID=UPI000FCD3464